MSYSHAFILKTNCFINVKSDIDFKFFLSIMNKFIYFVKIKYKIKFIFKFNINDQ